MVANNPQGQQGMIPLNVVQEAKKQTHVKKMVGDTRQQALAEGAFDMMTMIIASLKQVQKEGGSYIHAETFEVIVREFYEAYTK